ncbi:hypothetical protein [Ruminiclostridium cellulolyticum]|uniref:DUF4129 domain-containing protein n=1 Tax=Ruminiclostridium cellulolyticum (strain ATCC 35319 / DSM 5812 / JCM 6584 / H10) TaxID=394503 RepID=B8I699_RUMCH|nr:hypothetical protein [Ruminiclostridium cellulolyticum]ACL76864.1 hypothetical protein Ccel_2536 [Ruminiclostridium cellulolyticum H10]
MSKLFLLTNVFQGLAWMPVNFFIMQLVLPASTAVVLSFLMVVLTFLAPLLCQFNIKAYLYNTVSLAVSIFIGVASGGTVVGRFIVTVLCMVALVITWYCLKEENDFSMQTAILTLIINIIYGVINRVADMSDSVRYGNAAICISVISSVVLLIVRQVDTSRSFGKTNMDISRTQRRNNRIFGGVMILVLILMGTLGRISEIYKFVLRLIGKTFNLLGMLLSPGATQAEEKPMQQFQFPGVKASSGLFDEILKVVLDVLAVILIAGFTIYFVYGITKLIIQLVRNIARWLGNREASAVIVSENGLIDEKQSLYGKNLKNITGRFLNRARNIFSREVPYNKLPDGKAKVRRLFRNFVNKSVRMGVPVKNSSTAEEISKGSSAAAPLDTEVNNLMAKSYNAARYGDMEPLPGELKILEEKLNN